MAEAQAMPEVRASTWTRWIWNDMTTVDSVYPEFKPNWLLVSILMMTLNVVLLWLVLVHSQHIAVTFRCNILS